MKVIVEIGTYKIVFFLTTVYIQWVDETRKTYGACLMK
jgi:hypothetical protein